MDGAKLTLLVAALLLAPSAAAASAQGELVVQGDITISPSATGTARILAAFWENSSGMRELDVRAPRLHVIVFEFENVDAPVLLRQSVADRTRSFTLTDASVTLVDSRSPGWVGLVAEGPPSDAGLETAAARVSAREAPLGNAAHPADGGPASPFPLFAHDPHEEHALLDAPAALRMEGGATMKVIGPTLRISGKENETTFWTGTRPTSDLPGRTTLRWIVLRADDASIALSSDRPARLAVAEARLTTQGTLEAERATGEVASGEGAYVATQDDAVLTGDLSLWIAPAEAGGGLVARIDGELGGSTLAFARAPAPVVGARSLALVAAFALGAAVVGGAMLTRTLRKPVRTFTPEQYADLSHVAADEGRYGEALDWIRSARALAPTSSRLMLDEGSLKGKLGDVQGALESFAQGSAASSTGEGDFLAAVLLLETGAPPEEVAARLVDAVRRTPILALDIRDDPLFAKVARLPEMRRALEIAERLLDG